MRYDQFTQMTLDCMRTHIDLEKYSLTDMAELCECAKKLEHALAVAYPDLRAQFWKEYNAN